MLNVRELSEMLKGWAVALLLSENLTQETTESDVCKYFLEQKHIILFVQVQRANDVNMSKKVQYVIRLGLYSLLWQDQQSSPPPN